MKKKVKTEIKRGISACFSLVLVMILTLQSSLISQAASAPTSTNLTISFIKVDNGGHGDATLIDCKGKYYLVDGGKAGSYSQLKAHLIRK